jgi:hypothetical protein
VTQASFRWQQLVSTVPGSSRPKFKSRSFKSLAAKPVGVLVLWLLGLTVAIAMVIWYWKLVVAIATGILVMWFVYQMQTWNWQLYWSNLRRFWASANRQFTLAVASGGIACLGIYTAISIGVDTHSSWIAFGAILQGLASVLIALLLVWQIIARQNLQKESQLDNLIADLTHDQPLKRLVAVRQLIREAHKTQFDKVKQRSIADYFSLMLDRESESIVRDAVLEGLQALETNQRLRLGTSTDKIVPPLRRSTAKISG